MPRRYFSFATSVLIACGDGWVAPSPSQCSRVCPSPASTTNRPSSSTRRPGVSSGSTRQNVSAFAVSRAAATRSTSHTGPGLITRELRRCSHASRNSRPGESCSIARASRNWSSSLNATSPPARQPRNSATSPRWSVRVCSRAPYDRSSPTGTTSCSDSRATAAAGTEGRSSGTNPSHGSVHSCTATPTLFAGPRCALTNATSPRISVKYRISSSCAIDSGNRRSCSSSASENTLVATNHPRRAQTTTITRPGQPRRR